MKPPRHAAVVYGADDVRLDDPAELFHEASSFYPSFHRRQTPGAWSGNLEVLQALGSDGGKHFYEASSTALPQPLEGEPTSLLALLERRVSSREFAPHPLALDELATLLHAAQGVVGVAGDTGLPRRTAPSGGALYPLEAYVYAHRVAECDTGLFHYDPLQHMLARMSAVPSTDEVAAAFPHDELVRASAAVIVIGAMLWRSRFKYGIRAYRFALLEAGHAVQNVLLAAAALGLHACPIGGFYDRLLNDLLGIDSVNEVALYAVAVGRSV